MQLDDDDMQELMGNREYLESVLSSLPGVNPEEALHNLEEMRQAAQQQGDTKQDDKNKKVNINVIINFIIVLIIAG